MAMFAFESSGLDGRLMKKAVCKVNSLPKTEICPLKIGRKPKGKVIGFQPSIFRITPWKFNSFSLKISHPKRKAL